jgi:hypothetical protein
MEASFAKRVEILFFDEKERSEPPNRTIHYNRYGDANNKMMCSYLYVI